MTTNPHISETPLPQPQTPEQAAAVAHTDLTYHDQHGDSARWTEFEWESYHRAISTALARFRA